MVLRAMPRQINRPKIFTVVRNIWLTEDLWHESLFHSYVSQRNWNEYVRTAIVEYNRWCEIQPESPEETKRAREFPKFLEKTFKRQIKPKEKHATQKTKS